MELVGSERLVVLASGLRYSVLEALGLEPLGSVREPLDLELVPLGLERAPPEVVLVLLELGLVEAMVRSRC